MIGLVSAVMGFVWPAGAAILALAPRALVWYILSMARLLAGLPYHALYLANPYLNTGWGTCICCLRLPGPCVRAQRGMP